MIASGSKILKIADQNRSGYPVGITSVCSANKYVLKAAFLNAKKSGEDVLIESTSNQVDQFGGYTGLTPSGFRNYVFNLAEESEFPVDRIILGGDHLGPNRWQQEKSVFAMQKAHDQIAAYISAGYTKIHLDASMKLADDGSKNEPLEKSVIAERAASLCKTAEDNFRKLNNDYGEPVYVIGTDVPPPGGSLSSHNGIHITTTDDVFETIELTRSAFLKYKLEDAWKRVAAVVVQPGVEFGDAAVYDYDNALAGSLVKIIEKTENMTYEAHSTDYQEKEALRQMVKDHFAILKVGPWLTFAFREAVFALAEIEKELFSGKMSETSNIIEIIDERMNANPIYWNNYYYGTEEEKRLKRKYSYSDRIRYYWNDSEINKSLLKLLDNLKQTKIPDTLISQYLPDLYYGVRQGRLNAGPEELIIHKILNVLYIYKYATHGGIN